MALYFKNWQKFQHYKQRNPPWIKLHRSILDDIDYHRMSPLSAKLLILAWLIASEHEGKLPDEKTLSFRMRCSVSDVKKALVEWSQYLGGDASPALASDKQKPIAETETETETETEKSERRATKRAPHTWEPSASTIETLKAEKPLVDIEAELRKFRDHTFKTARSDWDATFRNWVRNAQPSGITGQLKSFRPDTIGQNDFKPDPDYEMDPDDKAKLAELKEKWSKGA